MANIYDEIGYWHNKYKEIELIIEDPKQYKALNTKTNKIVIIRRVNISSDKEYFIYQN